MPLFICFYASERRYADADAAYATLLLMFDAATQRCRFRHGYTRRILLRLY